MCVQSLNNVHRKMINNINFQMVFAVVVQIRSIIQVALGNTIKPCLLIVHCG